jgi:membrane-bound ClpP family serine protease
MGIGLGIVLIVVGLIVMFALQGDVPFFTDGTLGIILIVGGVLSLVIGLFMQFSRNRTKHVQENRYSGPPPAA